MTGSTDEIYVDYSQYYLRGPAFVPGADHEALDRIRAGNSLAAAAPDHLTVRCGTPFGPIRLTVVPEHTRPLPPGPEWETSVEVSLYSTCGRLGVQPWGDVPPPIGIRVDLTPGGPGWYRVRVDARGRDVASTHNTVEAWVEEHRITVWPEAPQVDYVHRVTDAFGLRTYDQSCPGLPPILPATSPPHSYDARLHGEPEPF